nr:hypothetical protein [Microbacterium bovistercoris]
MTEPATPRTPDEAGTPARVSLREELGGTPDPDFTLALPPGWNRRDATPEEQERMTAAMRTRLMQVHRPDLYARMRQLLHEAFAQMEKTNVVAMFLPDEAAPEALYLPASLTASILHAPAAGSLDDLVREAVAREGATPLLGDKRFLRAEREQTQTLDGESGTLTTVVYLTPIPGSGRRRALQLALVIVRPQDVPADDEPMVQMRMLFDLCVSTLTWLP